MRFPIKKSHCRTLRTLCPLWFNLFLAVTFCLGLSSCSGIARDMGMEEAPDLQQRAGITGTVDNPTPLDPFKKYELVMAANECRYFTMEVPSKWFWKIFLTAANREVSRNGRLTADIGPADPPWGQLPGAAFSKKFDLAREGLQALLGVGNARENRTAILRLCQEGAPLHITIESQVSATNALMGPKDIPTPMPDN
jgi:hypothetical protein